MKKQNSTSEKIKRKLNINGDSWMEKDGVSIFYSLDKFSEVELVKPTADFDRVKEGIPFCCVCLEPRLSSNSTSSNSTSSNSNSSRILVVSCHLPSGRRKYSDELARIESAGILSAAINEIMTTNKCNGLIIGMDGNTPPICKMGDRLNYDYYEEVKEMAAKDGSKVERSTVAIAAEGTMVRAVCDCLGMTIENIAIDNPTKCWSVCKMRGPTSEQPNKIGDPEYHLIDYIWVKGCIGVEKKAVLPLKKEIELDFSNLLPNFRSSSQDDIYVTTSDHLPVFCDLTLNL